MSTAKESIYLPFTPLTRDEGNDRALCVSMCVCVCVNEIEKRNEGESEQERAVWGEG